MIRHTILIVLAGTCAAATTISAALVPALAAPQSQDSMIQSGTHVVISHKSGRYSWPVRHVRFSDLDLTQASGQKVLSARVKKAVTSICGPDGPEDPLLRGDGDACRKVADASAKPQMAAAIDTAFAKKRLAQNAGYATAAGSR